MTKLLSLKELKIYLNKLLECDALELMKKADVSGEKLYIPYMMNDALENYLILNDCQITGSFSKKLPGTTVLEIVGENPDSGKNALIFRKANGDILTIWFSNCSQVLNFYQYHRIGHFWRSGQEHWRRLVYIIGTLHEKYTYLGEFSCNQMERELIHLMEFAPFRYWSPIHESLDEYYPDTSEGLECMQKLAEEAGDLEYARTLAFYQKLPFLTSSQARAKKLISEKREALYQLIDQKITLASERYPVRDYGPKQNLEIEKIRTQFTEKLYADGFTGKYPNFQKDDIQLLAIEEHPFTISELEYENFDFKIRGMINESGHHYLYPEI